MERNIIYKKAISKPHGINSRRNSKDNKSRNTKNLQNIISNTSFKIVSSEDIYPSIKKEEESNLSSTMNKSNLKICFYTKDCYQNIGEKYIIFIQRYLKNYLNRIKKNNIIKIPLLSLSFIEKIRCKNIINNNDQKNEKHNINISHFSENFLYIKKKKPVILSISKINYETLSTKYSKNNEINDDSTNIYKIPSLIKLCYFDKIYINKNTERIKKLNIIINAFKNWSNKKKLSKVEVHKKDILPVSFISKDYFDINLINLPKISLIQNTFRKIKKDRKIREDKLISEEKNKKYIQDLESINTIITNITKRHLINYFINKLKKQVKLSKVKYFLKMFTQRIKKIINQFTYEINVKTIIKNLKNKDNNETRKSDDNKEIPLDNDYTIEKYIFFFNTIKRHIKINELDNKLNSNDELVKLLKESIPEYFEHYPNMKYIPYIKKRNEKNLINQQLFLFDEDKLANYIYQCYKIEKNFLKITPEIIKKRLYLEPLKNQNIFTITRYMDNLYNDFTKSKLCKECLCKIDGLCLSGCKCNKMDNLEININQNESKKDEDQNNDSLDENLNINLTIHEETSHRDIKDLKIIKPENDRYSPNSKLDTNNYIKKANTFSKYNKPIYDSINNNDNNIDNSDKNSINTEYTQKHHSKINNFIRNFIFIQKLIILLETLF